MAFYNCDTHLISKQVKRRNDSNKGISKKLWFLMVNDGICLFRQLNGIWGWILVTTKGMTMKFLPDVGIYKETRNKKKNFDIISPVCKLQTKVPKNPIFWNANSRHAKFTKFCRIVHIGIRNKSWKFQIEISKIGYFIEHSVKWRQMLVCKIQHGL